MPVTGTLDTNKLIKGPVRIYVDVPLPADNTFLALTAGVPASGILAGLTTDGAKIGFTYNEASEEADEVAVPINKIISAESLVVEANLYQVPDDMVLLGKFAPTGTYQLNAGSAEGIKFGGIAAIPANAKPSVLVVGPLTSDPTKYLAVQLFSAINTNGLGWDWTRKKSGSVPIKLEAQAIATRSAGNQGGMIWKTLA